MSIRFSWDSNKAIRNPRAHDGVTFEEAATVFRDPTAYIFDDDEHADEEYSELIIGYSARSRLLIVSFTERNVSIINGTLSTELSQGRLYWLALLSRIGLAHIG